MMWRRNAASKRPNVNAGMCISFTFSLFEAAGQRKVCSPGFAWVFSDNASSRLTRFFLTAFFRFKSTYAASMMPRSHGRGALQSDRLRNAQTDIGHAASMMPQSHGVARCVPPAPWNVARCVPPAPWNVARCVPPAPKPFPAGGTPRGTSLPAGGTPRGTSAKILFSICNRKSGHIH